MEESIYKNAKILVVDDVEEVLNSTKNCLEFEGMDVTCINNPVEALEYLKNNDIDVVLLDFFMPEMNGDKFISELRKFNNETIVILRTGYSDKIPPLEMLDSLNIQGYIDKLKGDDELLLMTKSAIKTSYINKQLKEKCAEIAKLNHKKSILGDLITNLVNSAKDQLMIIAGMNASIEIVTNEFPEENKAIKDATEKIFKLYEALNFENLKEVSNKKFKEIIEILLKPSIVLANASLNIAILDENELINKNIVDVIYIIIEIVEIALKNNIKQIKIEIDNNDINIKVDKDFEICKNIVKLMNPEIKEHIVLLHS